MTRWLIALVADYGQQGIQNLVPQHDKCFSWGGNCVKKWKTIGTVTSELLLLKLKVKISKHVYYFLIFEATSYIHANQAVVISLKLKDDFHLSVELISFVQDGDT